VCVVQCGSDHETQADAVLVAAGREPALDDLGLHAAGVTVQNGSLMLDDRLRTTNHAIYAAGDVALEQRFTHAADASARLVVRNALFAGRRSMRQLLIPWVTYTDPEVAGVGLTEGRAAERDTAVDVYTRRLDESDRGRTDLIPHGLLKVITARGSDRILGGTIVAPHAGDMINELTIAMTAGFGLSRLAEVIRPYPTLAEAIRQLGDDYNRRRLTPRVRWALRQWLRL
jgi:pyruvate/2-oxoglutarate dehydrogenase complex dihydrolipoamide dehydrogenase (E3) component